MKGALCCRRLLLDVTEPILCAAWMATELLLLLLSSRLLRADGAASPFLARRALGRISLLRAARITLSVLDSLAVDAKELVATELMDRILPIGFPVVLEAVEAGAREAR